MPPKCHSLAFSNTLQFKCLHKYRTSKNRYRSKKDLRNYKIRPTSPPQLCILLIDNHPIIEATNMPSGAVTICKFVGTISVGLLTGVSTTLTAVSLPALLTLPTAINARTTLSYLQSRNKVLSFYLRHMAAFPLLFAFVLSPRRSRHPYLLYTSIFTMASGLGVDYAIGALRAGPNEASTSLDLEAQGDDVNGEQVRQAVERLQYTETVRAGVSGLAFIMGVVGIWGDGA